MDDCINFAIRAAGPDEMGTVAALFREYAADLGVDLGYQGFEAELADLPGRYAPPEGALLLAIAGGEAVGCVGVRPLDEPGACEMKRLHVRDSARGQGLGAALAAAAIGAAMHAGYSVMRLDTLPSMTSAITLYERLGFRRIAAYYDTPIAGTIFMEKHLRANGRPYLVH